jgi:hypothetical protein
VLRRDTRPGMDHDGGYAADRTAPVDEIVKPVLASRRRGNAVRPGINAGIDS